MLITSKQLIDLPVYTKSGQLLGEVDDFEIDIDEQLVVNYQVGSKNPIKNLLGNKLIIHRSQIVSVSADKVVVEDNVADKIEAMGQEEKIDEAQVPGAIASTTNSSDK